jgi:hypothetical protein
MLIRPKGLIEVKKVYGDFKFKDLSKGDIDIDDTWERDNIVRLVNVCGTGSNIRLHRLVAPVFETCLAEAIKRVPQYKVRMLGGFVPRRMRSLDPKKQLRMPISTHAWGIAFDINWDKNGFSKKLITDLPPAFVSAFVEEGWEWGGTWKNSKDAMHFQFATGI